MCGGVVLGKEVFHLTMASVVAVFRHIFNPQHHTMHTHTRMHAHVHVLSGDRSVPEKRGIIPNSFAHIFGEISKAEGNARCDSSVSVFRGAPKPGAWPCCWLVRTNLLLLMVCTTFFLGGGLLYRFLVRCSYLEIYCEDVKDLLGDVTKNLSVSSVP